MEGKKCVVPGEVCAVCSERGNHHCKMVLSVQKSAEAIVVVTRRAESVGVLSTTGKGENEHMGAEYIRNDGCSQRNSAEHKGYARARRSFNQVWKEKDSAPSDLLERILDKDNLNRAFKRVKKNKGAPGIDGMTIEETLMRLRKHNHELVAEMKSGNYTPKPVRRVEIPKPDGGIRKLGIPTVIDRIIQQAITQQMVPIYEPLFSEGSYGYRPGRCAQDAILRVKEYVENSGICGSHDGCI